MNASAGLLGINTLSWTATPVPEPNSILLFSGLGIAGLWLGRRARQSV